MEPQDRPVLIAGLGGLGSWFLELLGRVPGVDRLSVIDSNADWGRQKVYNVLTGLAFQGRYPRIDFHALDLRHVDAVAELISETQPRLLVNCATLQTWWLTRSLPDDIRARLSLAGAGPWVANHLPLAQALMLAHWQSDSQAPVINAAFPDAVNAILGRRGLAPTIGVGNMALLIPVIQAYVAEGLGVPPQDVVAVLVAHHYHTSFFRRGDPTDPPDYIIRVWVGDDDVTDQFDHTVELCRASQLRFADDNLNPVVASALVQLAAGVFGDIGLTTHAPGPLGLVGGYPIRLLPTRIQILLPTDETLERAMQINEQAQRLDGIERIEDDGTVVCTDQAVEVMQDLLGYDCSRVSLDDCGERSAELRAKFREFLTRTVGADSSATAVAVHPSSPPLWERSNRDAVPGTAGVPPARLPGGADIPVRDRRVAPLRGRTPRASVELKQPHAANPPPPHGVATGRANEGPR